ncbi:electron transfer flavoprotein subunit beta/FixA family protein [Lactococcus muris]|uniref:Electron transfer flavoprotein small subunit n=1 Tax=Lactococcus muris TaxID=2941330 RepID=A0ABV4DA84_9LACT
MKIICLVKFVPEPNKKTNFEVERTTGNMKREKLKAILNPEDASALAYALKMKSENPETRIEVLTMGPEKVSAALQNIVRLGADQATLLSDRIYQGSDSWATSMVLASYLKKQNFDYIFSGTQTIDGATGHIAPQVAELLKINQFSDVLNLKEINEETVLFDAAFDKEVLSLQMHTPCLLSMNLEVKMKLGFVRLEDMEKDVASQFQILSNEELQLSVDEVGRKGSPTFVRKDVAVVHEKKETLYVKTDEAGLEEVYQFLKEYDYV